jgi:hypothetical protein
MLDGLAWLGISVSRFGVLGAAGFCLAGGTTVHALSGIANVFWALEPFRVSSACLIFPLIVPATVHSDEDLRILEVIVKSFVDDTGVEFELKKSPLIWI